MSPLLQDGLNLTAIGMGVVFVLLTSLVFIVRGMSALSRVVQGPDIPARETQATSPATGPAAPEAELVIAISAAIAQYRKRR